MQFRSSLFLKTALLFSFTQMLGLYLAWHILPTIGTIPTRSLADFSWTDFIILAVTGFVFFFFSFRFPRFGAGLYRVFLTLVIFSISEMVLGIWLDPLLALTGAALVIIAFWIRQTVLIQNLVMILVLAGLGAIFGLSLTPWSVVIILIIFSLYDIIAVYKTGHMVKLAQMMVQAKAIFGFVVPNTYKGFSAQMREIEPSEQYMILGSGDVVLPLVLTASLLRYSLIDALVVGIFSLAGLWLTHLIFINQKTRRPMAALPPIALLNIAGYLLTTIL